MTSNSNQEFQHVFVFSKKADKEFSKLSYSVQCFIIRKLDEKIASGDPFKNAAKLVGRKHLYRHRFGSYRIIFSENAQGKLVVLIVLKVFHRKQVYENL